MLRSCGSRYFVVTISLGALLVTLLLACFIDLDAIHLSFSRTTRTTTSDVTRLTSPPSTADGDKNVTVLTEALERIERAMEGIERCYSNEKTIAPSENCSCTEEVASTDRHRHRDLRVFNSRSERLFGSLPNGTLIETHKHHHDMMERKRNKAVKQRKKRPHVQLGQYDPCCRRVFVGCHKMGHMALTEYRHQEFRHETTALFAKELFSKKKGHSKPSRFQLYTTRERLTKDYREVVIGRDLYATVISGYLYHKSGRECWLDWYGKPAAKSPGFHGYLNSVDFESVVRTYGEWDKDWPLPNQRTLCQYLADESEKVGVQAYTAFAMIQWLGPMLEYVQSRRQEHEEENGCTRTVFLCLDDLSPTDPLHDNLTASLYKFFGYENRTRGGYGVNVAKVAEISNHGTSHDPDLRSRLKKYVEQMDESVLDGRIRESNSWFGCRSEID